MKKKKLAFKITKSGCFEVVSHLSTSNGYVPLMICGRQTRAHRHIWEECFGPIPKGMCVLHECDNRVCINPEHLFLGTDADNVYDMYSKGRGGAKLTPDSVREIKCSYLLYSKKRGIYALGKKFGVHPTTVWAVLHKESV
jgi:hypothetical protein